MIFLVVINISAFLSTIGFVIGCWYVKRIMSFGNSEAVRKSIPYLMHNFSRITYRELIFALIPNFSSEILNFSSEIPNLNSKSLIPNLNSKSLIQLSIS